MTPMYAQTTASLRTEEPIDGQRFGLNFNKKVQRPYRTEFFQKKIMDRQMFNLELDSRVDLTMAKYFVYKIKAEPANLQFYSS